MSSTNALQKHLGLKPMQQTSLWTFNSALSILKDPSLAHIQDALDEFLIHSEEVLLLPCPFKKPENQKPLESVNELALRGILYTDVKPNISMAQKLSDLLDVDSKDALRVINQTEQRIPRINKKTQKLTALTSKLPDDRATQEENESLVFYASMLLKERRTVIQIIAECFRKSFTENVSSTIRNLGKSIDISSSYLKAAIGHLSQVAKSIMSSSYLEDAPDALNDLKYTESILYVLDLLGFICEILLTMPSELVPVKDWFDFMNDTGFMVDLGPQIANRESFVLLQALVTVVTLQVLNPSGVFDVSEKTYVNDGKCFSSINNSVLAGQSNSVISYAWLLVLFKKSVILEEFKHAQQEFLGFISHETIQQTIESLSAHLNSSAVFEEIVQLNKFLYFSDIFSAVLADLLIVALPVMAMTAETATCVREVMSSAPIPAVEKFFQNEEIRNALVLARAKSPVSIAPYLKLASINGKFAYDEFKVLRSYMSVFNKEEFQDMYEIDSDDTELVKLAKMVDLFPPYELKNKMSLLIKPDTKAKIIPSAQADKVLVTFLHEYSGWAFLGRVIQNISKSFDFNDPQKMMILIDILQLLCKTVSETEAHLHEPLLNALSSYVDDSDIVEILFRLFEQGLHNRNVQVSEHLLRLFTGLIPTISPRLWPYLSKSSLLLSGGKDSFMVVMFGFIEMIEGEYSFTISLSRFVYNLVCHSVSAQDGYPEAHKSEILLNMVDHLVLAFESFSNCKFNDGFQRLELGVLIIDVFRKILETTFCTESYKITDKKPVNILHASAQRIVKAFLLEDKTSSRASTPILQTVSYLALHSNYYDFRDVTGTMSDYWIESVLSFSELLIDIRSILERKPSQFEKDWFLSLGDLVTIYSRGSFRVRILGLISSLTKGKWDSEPMPSMLSHLGKEHSNIFLHSLAADLDNSFETFSIRLAVYDLICSIMEANQQGISVLFVSGQNIFGDLSDKGKLEKKSSLLSLLIRNVNDIKHYPAPVTTHLLDAISLAFNARTVSRPEDFDENSITPFIEIVNTYESHTEIKSSEDLITVSYQNKVFAKTVEILSYILFTTKSTGIQQKIISLLLDKGFTAKLPALFSVQNHRVGLQTKTSDAFSNAFQGFTLSQFVSLFSKRNRYGGNTVYELGYMNELFGENEAWAGIKPLVEECSANIQNFFSQVDILKSLGALITSFCRKFPNKVLSEYFALVPKLLSFNESGDAAAKKQEDQLCSVRIELAFLIAFTIYNSQSVKKESSVALDVLQEIVHLLQLDNHVSTDEHSVAHKTLLRLAFVALTIVKDDTELIVMKFSILDLLFELVVAKKSCGIIIAAQNDAYLSKTGSKTNPHHFVEALTDLRLILSIFKMFVELKVPESMHHYFKKALEKQKTVERFLDLYSFSHLILVDDQPLFSYFSLMFLQTLLGVDVFAEKFANADLFRAIRESLISRPLREGGVTIEDSPQLHKNWADGILPILTTSFKGPGDKVEVLKTLSDFGRQIAFCIDAWSKDSSTLRVSTAATWETTQILFIYKTLKEVVAAKKPFFQGPNGVDMAILPGLELPQKREDFVDYVSNLLKHPKFLTSRIVPSSIEEALIIESNGPQFEKLVSQLVSEISELKELIS